MTLIRLGRVLRSTRPASERDRWVCQNPGFCTTRRISYSSNFDSFTPLLLPSDQYQLLGTREKAGEAEDKLFNEQVEELRNSWASPRFEGIKRPYMPADVVNKRGALQQLYPSSLMAKKLFNLLKERAAVKQPVHTCEH